MGFGGITKLIPKVAPQPAAKIGAITGGWSPGPQQQLDEFINAINQQNAAADPGPTYDDSGGYSYDDGGGYASGGGLPPYDPATDPSYQALLAQLGLSETLARTTADQQKAQAGRQFATQIPRIQEAGIEQRRGIGFNAEARGMYRSGQRLRDLSLQQRGENERLTDNYTGLADRGASIDQGLQSKLNDLATQKVQAGFEAKLRASGA